MKLARTVIPQVVLEATKLRYNKTILFQFCEHLKNVPLDQLLNDKSFIDLIHKHIHGIPTLQSRAFQLAFEMTYAKRKCDAITLQQYYENDFIIKDTFDVNKGVCDQSTIYTAILTKHLTQCFNLDKKDVVVNATPIFSLKDKMTPELEALMEYYKKMTGNRCNDISLMERPYDYKDTKEFSYSSNHLYLIDKQNIAAETVTYLYELEKYFRLTIKQNVVHKDVRQYMQEMLNIIENNNVSKKSSQETYETILTFTLKKTPPKDFKMAILFYADKFKLPDINLKQEPEVALDPGMLTDTKVKKAIYGIVDKWPAELKDSVQKATHASLSWVIEQTNKPL